MSKNTNHQISGYMDRHFDIVLCGLGIDLWITKWYYPNVTTECYRLYWNETPGGMITFQGKTLELTPEVAVLIPPYTSFSAGGNAPFRHFYVHFRLPPPFDNVRREILTFPGKRVAERIHSLRECRGTVHEELRLRLLIIECLDRMPGDFILDAEHPAIHQGIRRSIDYINTHLGEHLECRELSRRGGLSLNHFYRLFKRETGVTCQQYIMHQRMARAVQLLRDTEVPVKEIAQLTAFADRYHFSKVFQRFFSQSPARFRRELRK